MKNSLILVFFAAFQFCFSQEQQLTNLKLIKYFQLINLAEISIVDHDWSKAQESYNEAFKILDQPQPKDIYNQLVLSLKLSDKKKALEDFQILTCLEYRFDDDFVKTHFPEQFNSPAKPCSRKLDYHYKKQLDSLFETDQHYRRLSGGDYEKYKTEITKNDSAASISLKKLIKTKGFPDAYSIGLNNENTFFPNFYYIIWHQMAENRYSPQRVNFSDEIYKALNEGKIAPDHAAFLIELMNNTKGVFNLKHFEITEFLPSESDPGKSFTNIKEKLQNTDCCYVHEWFFPEKRNENGKKQVKSINENRAKIGLCSLDDDIKKRVFSIKNKDYQFVHTSIVGRSFVDEKYVEFLKQHLIKLNLQ